MESVDGAWEEMAIDIYFYKSNKNSHKAYYTACILFRMHDAQAI